MVIRCERCSTLYELDESLLAPTGSQVQCTKCENVFVAYPPRAPGRTLVGVPAAPEGAETPAPVAPSAPVAASPAAEPPASRAPPPPPAPAPPPAAPASADAARRRSGPAPVYRPPSPVAAAPQAVRSPVLRRDTVGTFEARLRWTARWRWLAPTLLAGIVALAVAGWMALSRRGDAGAERARGEAQSLLLRDDLESLDAAAAQLDLAVQRAPKRGAAAADRILADVLRATSMSEEGEALLARAALRAEERDRLRREQPAGWEASEKQAAEDAAALEAQARTRADRSRGLLSGAHEALRALQAEIGDTPEVARAAAVFQASGGERERVHRLVRAAREKGVRDAWLDLADGWADARDTDRASRERALVRLGALAAARPDLLRGRYLLARAQAALGKRSEAVASLDGLLTANQKHEAAKRLREDLTAPAVAPAQPVPVPAPATAPANPPPRRRKPVPQPAPAASAPTPPEAGPLAPAPEASGGATAVPDVRRPEPVEPPAAPPTPAPAPSRPPPEPLFDRESPSDAG